MVAILTSGQMHVSPLTASAPGKGVHTCDLTDLVMFRMLNHRFVEMRLRRIDDLIQDQSDTAVLVINMLLRNLRHPDVIYVGISLRDREIMFDHLFRALVELAMKRYNDAHGCIRNLHCTMQYA